MIVNGIDWTYKLKVHGFINSYIIYKNRDIYVITDDNSHRGEHVKWYTN